MDLPISTNPVRIISHRHGQRLVSQSLDLIKLTAETDCPTSVLRAPEGVGLKGGREAMVSSKHTVQTVKLNQVQKMLYSLLSSSSGSPQAFCSVSNNCLRNGHFQTMDPGYWTGKTFLYI